MACFLKNKMVEFSEEPNFWTIISEPTTGNVIISAVDALKFVVLSKTEKSRALWRISWYHIMYDIWANV
jgi:hypothetical protein